MGSPEYIEFENRQSMVQAILDARAADVAVETVDGFRMLYYPDGTPKKSTPKKVAKKEEVVVEADVEVETETEDDEDLIGE